MLGPVQAVADGVRVGIGGSGQRCALGLLAIEAGAAVRRETLSEALWGTKPPAGKGNALQAVMSRLRRAVAPHAGVRLATGGYVLDLGEASVDLGRFRALVGAARDAGDAEAARLLGAALALWRGEPLADVRSDLVRHRVAPELAGERMAAQLHRHEAMLRLGRVAEVMPDLRALVEEHPYDGRLCGQLMRALYESGRPAEALAAFRTLRRRLAGELGIEPDADLRALEQAVLRGERLDRWARMPR